MSSKFKKEVKTLCEIEGRIFKNIDDFMDNSVELNKKEYIKAYALSYPDSFETNFLGNTFYKNEDPKMLEFLLEKFNYELDEIVDNNERDHLIPTNELISIFLSYDGWEDFLSREIIEQGIFCSILTEKDDKYLCVIMPIRSE